MSCVTMYMSTILLYIRVIVKVKGNLQLLTGSKK